MRKLTYLIGTILAFLSVNSCREIDYGTITNLTFVNESSHMVAVVFEKGTASEISDFTLEPTEQCTYSYTHILGLDIDSATVTYDNRISIKHGLNVPNCDGFRNICKRGSWWEHTSNPDRKKYGYNASLKFTFSDADFEYARDHQ